MHTADYHHTHTADYHHTHTATTTRTLLTTTTTNRHNQKMHRHRTSTPSSLSESTLDEARIYQITMESPTGFSTIPWLQRNPNLDSEEHSIFHKQRCMARKESQPQSLELFYLVHFRDKGFSYPSHFSRVPQSKTEKGNGKQFHKNRYVPLAMHFHFNNPPTVGLVLARSDALHTLSSPLYLMHGALHIFFSPSFPSYGAGHPILPTSPMYDSPHSPLFEGLEGCPLSPPSPSASVLLCHSVPCSFSLASSNISKSKQCF
ncbi:hypothetical protein FHG87_010829 [Trinorchestia longiramus]|nr:hypothetical protein FHG87_010829 [Trinorchestia longiramus]